MVLITPVPNIFPSLSEIDCCLARLEEDSTGSPVARLSELGIRNIS